MSKIRIACCYDEMVPIGQVLPHPMNPNEHPEDQIELLSLIIEESGWRDPITISKKCGYVIRGHGRLMAAELLKMKTVPVDYQDYESEADEMADLVADNRIQELSELDLTMVKELISDIKDRSAWVTTAFDIDEIDKLMEDQTGFLDEFRSEDGSDETDESGGGDPGGAAAGSDPVEKYYKLPILFTVEDRNFIIYKVSEYQRAQGMNLSSDALLRMCVNYEKGAGEGK